MESNKPIICGPENSYTVDLPFENDIDQDEVNRTRRKPGAPPYNPNAKWMDPPVVPPNGAQEKPATDSQKS